MGNAIKAAMSVGLPEPRQENTAGVGLRRNLDLLVKIFILVARTNVNWDAGHISWIEAQDSDNRVFRFTIAIWAPESSSGASPLSG